MMMMFDLSQRHKFFRIGAVVAPGEGGSLVDPGRVCSFVSAGGLKWRRPPSSIFQRSQRTSIPRPKRHDFGTSTSREMLGGRRSLDQKDPISGRRRLTRCWKDVDVSRDVGRTSIPRPISGRRRLGVRGCEQPWGEKPFLRRTARADHQD